MQLTPTQFPNYELGFGAKARPMITELSPPEGVQIYSQHGLKNN